MKSIKKLIKGKKQVAPAPPPAPTAEQIAKSKEEALDRTCAEAERLFKLDQDKGGRRKRKTRRGGSVGRATRLKEMKIQYESVRDLKKTGTDMQQKIEEIAAAFKLRGGDDKAFGESLLTTLNGPDGLKNAKSMLEGFFMNVPGGPDTTRKSRGGRTRKYRE
jgi:hypothetical protein